MTGHTHEKVDGWHVHIRAFILGLLKKCPGAVVALPSQLKKAMTAIGALSVWNRTVVVDTTENYYVCVLVGCLDMLNVWTLTLRPDACGQMMSITAGASVITSRIKLLWKMVSSSVDFFGKITKKKAPRHTSFGFSRQTGARASSGARAKTMAACQRAR